MRSIYKPGLLEINASYCNFSFVFARTIFSFPECHNLTCDSLIILLLLSITLLIETIHSQLTVNGVDGPVGQDVLSVVEVVKGQERNRAPIQHLLMAVKRV